MGERVLPAATGGPRSAMVKTTIIRPGPEPNMRVDPAAGTGDHHDPGGLALREAVGAQALFLVGPGAEPAAAVDAPAQARHQRNRSAIEA